MNIMIYYDASIMIHNGKQYGTPNVLGHPYCSHENTSVYVTKSCAVQLINYLITLIKCLDNTDHVIFVVDFTVYST